jgi:hypothetical protein
MENQPYRRVDTDYVYWADSRTTRSLMRDRRLPPQARRDRRRRSGVVAVDDKYVY